MTREEGMCGLGEKLKDLSPVSGQIPSSLLPQNNAIWLGLLGLGRARISYINRGEKGTMVHAFKPSTCKAQAGGYL